MKCPPGVVVESGVRELVRLYYEDSRQVRRDVSEVASVKGLCRSMGIVEVGLIRCGSQTFKAQDVRRPASSIRGFVQVESPYKGSHGGILLLRVVSAPGGISTNPVVQYTCTLRQLVRY